MFFNWLIGLLSKLFLWTGLIKSKNAFAKPLSGKEEDELFDRLSKGDKEAEELLIKHNLRLVAFVAKKYKNFLIVFFLPTKKHKYLIFNAP